MAVEQMKAVIRVIVREMTYKVPPQELKIDLARIPALPRSGFLMPNVRLQIDTLP